MNFLPASADLGMLKTYERLFSECFGSAPKFSPATLKWLYADNPCGKVVGFDAFDGEELAAHYVCVPADVRIGGNIRRVLLSLNTATHPKYQGQGLFTRLAEMTYAAGAEQGFEAVYGVANANSTPGFIRKLGFDLVQPLEAKVGLGRLRVDFSAVSRNAEFERVWTPEALAWRLRNPANPVKHVAGVGMSRFYAKAFGSVLPAYAELETAFSTMSSREAWGSPVHLYLGLVPATASKFTTFVDIPNAMRPSPLNLIFRSLRGSSLNVAAGAVFFSFLDFDAY